FTVSADPSRQIRTVAQGSIMPQKPSTPATRSFARRDRARDTPRTRGSRTPRSYAARMENAQNAADHPAAQAVQDPAEHPSDQAVSAAGAAESGAAGADTAAGTDTAAGAAEMSQLGIDGARPNAPKPLS